MLFLFNTTIMPNEGVFVNTKVSVEKAEQILKNHAVPNINEGENPHYQFMSALGHQGSADAFNALFPGLNCEVNRIPAVMRTGDQAIALKVLGRLPEGQILDLAGLQEIGFEFYYIRMIADNIGDLEQAAVFAGAAPITGAIWG